MAARARTAQAESQSQTKPGLPERTHGGEWRLLPLSGYEDFRARLDRRLAAHSALRQRWQARLELRAAPTLREYVSITKDNRLTGQRREAYRQAAIACRNANRLKEYQGVRNSTG